MTVLYATVLDGPYVGTTTRVLLRDIAMVPVWCAKPIGGQWLHHTVDEAASGFRYAGTCEDVDHHEDDRICGTWWGLGSGGAHCCNELGRHDNHRCCCGAEEPRTDA